MLVRLDTREDYGEDRWQGIGTLRGRVVVAVFVQKDANTIRIISLRKATRREKSAYQKIIAY